MKVTTTLIFALFLLSFSPFIARAASVDTAPAKDRAMLAVLNVFDHAFGLGLSSMFVKDTTSPQQGFLISSVIGDESAKNVWVVRHRETAPCTYDDSQVLQPKPDSNGVLDIKEPAATISFDKLTREYRTYPSDAYGMHATLQVTGVGQAVCDQANSSHKTLCHSDLVIMVSSPDQMQSVIRSLSYIFENVCRPAAVPPL